MGISCSGMLAKLLYSLVEASNTVRLRALEATRSQDLDPSRMRAAMLKGTA